MFSSKWKWLPLLVVLQVLAHLGYGSWLSPQTRVRLWHPLGQEITDVARWRQWLQENEISQPFKQAHREIYILTDAELETDTYSNRFAAHIIGQHQFAALAQERGWKYRLQGKFDSHNVPTIELPRWNLAVQFWLEAGDGGGETSEMGIFLHVATDQVRFCNADGDPRPLSEVPALVFSELMRDVDLFVGVCSIGNDPRGTIVGMREVTMITGTVSLLEIFPSPRKPGAKSWKNCCPA